VLPGFCFVGLAVSKFELVVLFQDIWLAASSCCLKWRVENDRPCKALPSCRSVLRRTAGSGVTSHFTAVWLSVCLSVCLYNCQLWSDILLYCSVVVCLFVCLSVCLQLPAVEWHLTLPQSACLTVYLSVCLSVNQPSLACFLDTVYNIRFWMLSSIFRPSYPSNELFVKESVCAPQEVGRSWLSSGSVPVRLI
jgi:hypothetical protein